MTSTPNAERVVTAARSDSNRYWASNREALTDALASFHVFYRDDSGKRTCTAAEALEDLLLMSRGSTAAFLTRWRSRMTAPPEVVSRRLHVVFDLFRTAFELGIIARMIQIPSAGRAA